MFGCVDCSHDHGLKHSGGCPGVPSPTRARVPAAGQSIPAEAGSLATVLSAAAASRVEILFQNVRSRRAAPCHRALAVGQDALRCCRLNRRKDLPADAAQRHCGSRAAPPRRLPMHFIRAGRHGESGAGPASRHTRACCQPRMGPARSASGGRACRSRTEARRRPPAPAPHDQPKWHTRAGRRSAGAVLPRWRCAVARPQEPRLSTSEGTSARIGTQLR